MTVPGTATVPPGGSVLFVPPRLPPSTGPPPPGTTATGGALVENHSDQTAEVEFDAMHLLTITVPSGLIIVPSPSSDPLDRAVCAPHAGQFNAVACRGLTRFGPSVRITTIANDAGLVPAPAVTYPAGWSLVGGPEDTALSGLSGPLYTLQPGSADYQSILPLDPKGCSDCVRLPAGKGFWAYFQEATTLDLALGVPQTTTITLPAATWVMIGNPFSTAAAASGADLVFTYDQANGYQPAEVLPPGQGAWAYSAAGGALTLSPVQQ